MLFENWKNSPSHRAKICPQKAGFSAFLSHGKFKLVMKKSWKSHWILLPNFCMNPVSTTMSRERRGLGLTSEFLYLLIYGELSAGP